MKNQKKHPRPVLMTPLRRCGSHALRLRLNSSPDFYAPYPLHIIDFMPLLNLYGDLSNDNNYFQLITDIIGLQSGLMVKWPNCALDPVEIFESLQNEPRSIHRVVWELLFETGRQQGARVVMDKSLDNINYADELLEIFPDMLFLNVVRDPRAQISSMNKAIIHDFHTLLNAQTWASAYEKSRALSQKHPEKVLTIRFEDFITNEPEIIQQISEFFGIHFSSDMLDIKNSSEAQSISTRSALWECNSSAPIAAAVDKFRKSLSHNEIEIIETLTGDFMDYYGYEKMTQGKAKINNKEIDEAIKLSEKIKNQSWNELKANNPRDYILRKFREDYLHMLRTRLTREKDLFIQSA